MLNIDLIRSLKSQSTWRLFGLGFITIGTYNAHYIAKQTRLINQHLDEKDRVAPGFVTAIYVVSYLSLGLFIAYWFVDETHPVAALSNQVDRIWIVMMIFWGYAARGRLNQINSAMAGEAIWFHGLWTFLFSPLYFNYKINVLNERVEEELTALH